MTKKHWEEKYKNLDDAYREFLFEYPRYKNGKNEGIRKEAERNVDRAIGLCRMLIEGNSEIASLFVTSEYGGMFRQGEFFQTNYFGSDMSAFLKIIRQHIDSLSDEPSHQ